MGDKGGCKCGEETPGSGKAAGFRLESLVEYAEDSVISRVLLEEDGGTVTVFAFDEGQGFSEHSAPYDAMVQVIDGEACITIKGVPHEIRKGEVIIMPANVPHALRAVSRFKMLLTMIRKD